MRNTCLPFPRGSTWSDGTVTMADGTAPEVEGRVFEADDTEHGTGEIVKLRVVKNDTGGDITVDARNFCDFSTTSAYDFGRRVRAFGLTVLLDGVPCKPMDDAYPLGTVIPNHDKFYVVEAGPCSVAEAASASFSAGDAVTTDTNGQIKAAACAAGEYPVGVADADAAGDGSDAVIHVNEGLSKPPAAG